MAQQEWPGVDEVDPIHGYHDNAVPALEAPCQAVFDEKRMRENESVLFISEEDGPLSTRTNLQEQII